MAGLNMRAKATLDVGGFKAGARTLRTEINGLKSSFMGFTGALGASLGLFRVMSQMKDVAIGMSVARATLKNVSNGIDEYNSNLEFTKRLSTEYHQDLITLTDSFSRFHAAAMGTNFSLEQQKDMYEGLVQAATYFHMSSERTENMLIAVEQMMSKGKVTAEELRRQLGNNLPGAYAKMAQAAIQTGYAGVKSFADFEKAMKAGKIGVDLLTKFVENLKKETEGFDPNSLVLKMNDLKNAFIKFTESSNFEEWFTKVIDKSIKALEWFEKNFKAVMTTIITIASTVIGVKLVKIISSLIKWGEVAVKSFIKGVKAVGTALASLGSNIKTLSMLVKGLRIASIATGWAAAVTLIVTGISKITGEVKKYKKEVNDTADALARMASAEWQSKDAQSRYDQAKQWADSSDQWLRENHDKYQANLKRLEYLNGPNYTAPAFVTNAGQMRMAEVERLNREIKLYQDKEKEYAQAMLAYKAAEKELKKITEGQTVGGTGNTETTENKFEKTLQKYIDKQKELDNQLKAGAITLEKYNAETNDLVEKSWKAITAFDNFRDEMAKLPAKMQKAGAHLEEAFGNIGLTKSIEAITDASIDYFKEFAKQKALYDKGYVSEQDYNKALLKASDSAVEAMSAIKNLEVVLSYLDPITQQVIGSIIQQYSNLKQAELSEKQTKFAAEVGKIDKVPNLPARWAYKDTTSQFYTKMANGYENIAEKYQKAIEEAKEDTEKLGDIKLEDLQKEFEDATQKAKSFKDMADISEWALEVKDLRKEWRQGLFGGVKSTADAMDRLTSGVKSFVETMNDTDASAWEKILATLNEIIQTMDVLMSLTETYMTLRETHKNLQRAQNAEELKQLSTEYFINGQLAAQKQEEMALDAAATSQSSANAAASLSEQSALAGEAVAGATASGAKLAFPYNLIAIAAGVAAVVGALSSMKKYASGGIVKGSLNGDRNLVGVNGNEMILNGNQQGRLWNLINHGGANTGGKQEVQFKIAGKDLVGVIKNYNTIKKG